MTTRSTDDAKEALRDRARASRARLDASERADAARAAAAHFFAAVEFGGGDVVGAYWPIRDEIDCRPVLTRLMDDGQPVCLPVVLGEDAPLRFSLWAPGEPLYPAGFGTLVPGDEAPVVEPDILLVPLLGFDARGTRLGYGRAYYDRSIAGFAKPPLVVGYAFSIQELPEIPRDDHDVPLDLVVTEDGVRRFDRPSPRGRGNGKAPAAGSAAS